MQFTMRNRRNFLQTLIRGGMFASLAFLGGSMISRWREVGGCPENTLCGKCNEFNGCRFPEADKYRLDQARKSPNKPPDGNREK